MMSEIVVIYHSGYGHTQKQAEAVANGASADLIEIDANGDIAETAWDQLN